MMYLYTDPVQRKFANVIDVIALRATDAVKRLWI